MKNLDQEELWIKSWDELYNLIEEYPNCHILIDKYKEVTLEEAQDWIQNLAYESSNILFNIEYYKGKKSILITKKII